MPFLKTLICCFLAMILFTAGAQQQLYPFQKQDTVLRDQYYQQALLSKNNLINSLGKEHKKDYKEIYEDRFEAVAALLKGTTTVTDPTAHTYIQTVFKKITDANPELKDLGIRLVFTREGIPNAFCMGEGTLAVNAGLFIYLDNESQLAFILCHELAHQYLAHSNKNVKKRVDLINSKELKKESKALSKQEYGVGQKLEELVKKLAFGILRHSREDEAEADKVGFRFMTRTGYDCKEAKTCLQLLDRIDDTTLFKPVNLEDLFRFSDYSFKKKWIQKESAIFSAMSTAEDDSPFTKAEKDSLRTHPDCKKRIALLEDTLKAFSNGQRFIANETYFNQLKKDFIPEIAEQAYRDDNLGLYLYLCLQMLQKQEYEHYAAYGVVRCLNRLYAEQKNHRLGAVAAKENRRYHEDYNLVLRMIDRLRLEDIASLSYYFGKKYNGALSGFSEFAKEMRKAEQLRSSN
jgi:hypothetical protein